MAGTDSARPSASKINAFCRRVAFEVFVSPLLFLGSILTDFNGSPNNHAIAACPASWCAKSSRSLAASIFLLPPELPAPILARRCPNILTLLPSRLLALADCAVFVPMLR
jgi:hypothetical protein